jgi:hypothetical protein
VGISTAADALTHTERLQAGFAASLLWQAGQALQAVLLAALALRCSMGTLGPAHTRSGTRARL